MSSFFVYAFVVCLDQHVLHNYAFLDPLFSAVHV